MELKVYTLQSSEHRVPVELDLLELILMFRKVCCVRPAGKGGTKCISLYKMFRSTMLSLISDNTSKIFLEIKMHGVKVSKAFGIVILKLSVEQKGIPINKIFDLMETTSPFDEDAHLLSFGPHFGGEAADEFAKRLDAIGLKYAVDFYVFDSLTPEWIEVRWAFSSENP